MTSRRKTLVILLIAVVLAGGGFAALSAYARPREGVIPEGVRFAGMDWSSKPTATARAELVGWSQARIAERLPLSVTFANGRKLTWNPTRAELGADVDIDATVRAAEKARDDESRWSRLSSLFARPDRIDVEPKWELKAEAARKYLDTEIAPKAAREPRDARFLVTKEGFKVVPEQPGSKLDTEGALKQIIESLDDSPEDPLALPLTKASPRVTTADLQGIEGEVSKYTTRYGERGNRRRNIENACRRINGTVLKPGDVFSYNKVVGPREAENGFRLAPVIVRGRLEPGLGGGICQTSSTLYNAVLLAGLKVVRRSHHAFPVHYVSPGRDATVVYGHIDFKFKNDTDAPIAIAAEGSGGRVSMRVFGKKAPGRQIRIERSHVSSWGAPVSTVTDRSLRAGKRRTILKGHSGHRAKVWRVVKQDGVVVRRELISSDHYAAVPYVVAVGAAAPKSAPKPPAPAQPTAPPTLPPPNGAE